MTNVQHIVIRLYDIHIRALPKQIISIHVNRTRNHTLETIVLICINKKLIKNSQWRKHFSMALELPGESFTTFHHEDLFLFVCLFSTILNLVYIRRVESLTSVASKTDEKIPFFFVNYRQINIEKGQRKSDCPKSLMGYNKNIRRLK